MQMPSCGECLAQNPIQHRSISAFDYAFPLAELITQIKFQKQLHHLDLLAALFTEYCAQQYKDDVLPQLLIPVPLHPSRQFQRGFNQSELLAKRISHKLNIAIEPRAIRRITNTKSQMALSIKERKTNMQGAFNFIHRKSRLDHCTHVAIFDDVITTGATTRSICKLLKKSGVQRIDIWSIARTPKPN
jgi:ComF family protein